MKGQTSMEFIIFVGVMLMLFSLASYVAVTSLNDITTESEITGARNVASTLASEINLAKEVGTGYKHTFSLPAYLYSSTNYSINLSDSRFVRVEWKNRFYLLPTIAENVTGTAKSDGNVIKNIDGVIRFE